MTEEAPGRPEPYKIWRNPATSEDRIAYLGEFYPPAGRVLFVASDLSELGFRPGEYTLRAPDRRKGPLLIPKWQKLRVVE